MHRPLVTVVVPTRNRLEYLVECIDSVRRQSYSEWELIVVDDASTDGTAAWLDAIGSSQVRTLRLDTRSEKNAARNRGLAEARGDLVTFLDDDDRFRPSALEHLIRPFRLKTTDISASVGGAITFDSAGHRRRSAHPRFPVTADVWREVLFGYLPGEPGRTCIRRSGLNTLAGWTEARSFLTDSDLWLRLSRLGRVSFVPYTTLEIRMHGGQYRPLDADERHTELRQTYAATLRGGDRRLAARVLSSREQWLTGLELSGLGEFGQAARHFARAFRACPELCRSPVVGMSLLARAAKTVALAALGPLGPGVRDTGVRLKSTALAAAKRLPTR